MKKVGRTRVRAAMLDWLLVATPGVAAAPFHIGVCTDPAEQSLEPGLGAEQLIKEYGSVKEGGYIQHVTSPKGLASLAKDPLMKVIVSCTVVKGVAEAYRTIRAKRPEILLLAGESWEDTAGIQRAADLIVDLDPVSRGFAIPWGARQLGAGSLVYISFPRHQAMKERIGRTKVVMEQACKDLGMTFAYEEAIDYRTNKEAAKAFIAENVPKWIKKYGSGQAKVAFYCTQDGLAYHVVKQVLDCPDAVFLEEDCASPLTVDADLFGLDPAAEHYDFSSLLKKIEAAAVARGASGRVGTSTRGCSYTFTAGLGEFAKRLVEGKAQILSADNLCEALGKYTPGSAWKGSFHMDTTTGERAKNRFMLYTDTYVFGKGFLGTTVPAVPEAYFGIQP